MAIVSKFIIPRFEYDSDSLGTNPINIPSAEDYMINWFKSFNLLQSEKAEQQCRSCNFVAYIARLYMPQTVEAFKQTMCYQVILFYIDDWLEQQGRKGRSKLVEQVIEMIMLLTDVGGWTREYEKDPIQTKRRQKVKDLQIKFGLGDKAKLSNMIDALAETIFGFHTFKVNQVPYFHDRMMGKISLV